MKKYQTLFAKRKARIIGKFKKKTEALYEK